MDTCDDRAAHMAKNPNKRRRELENYDRGPLSRIKPSISEREMKADLHLTTVSGETITNLGKECRWMVERQFESCIIL